VAKIRIGIVGFGKIAQDQHRPAIEADPAFQLGAVVARDRIIARR
jgi:predicted dehydrogenase